MEDILKSICDWLGSGKSAALITVISRQGSAPREVGAKMAVSSDMQIVGSVSSGCVESAVAEEAIKAMRSGEAVVLEYGISNDQAWSIGLTCGGQIKVLVQPVGKDIDTCLNCKILDVIDNQKQAKKKFSVVTALSASQLGNVCLVSDGRMLITGGDNDNWIPTRLFEKTKEMEQRRQSGILHVGDNEFFIDVSAPPERLVIIGAVHVAIPLAHMAKLMGFEVIIVDPRGVFASEERFPMVDRLVKEWPTEGLEKIHFSWDDYIVLLSHDDKLDLPALAMALDKKAKYIGMLSSKSSRDKRYEIMFANGYKPNDLEKVFSPIGLDIGGKSAEEIALSIMAEITAVKNDKLGRK